MFGITLTSSTLSMVALHVHTVLVTCMPLALVCNPVCGMLSTLVAAADLVTIIPLLLCTQI